MEKYVTLLPYEVMDNVLKGRTVYLLDKELKDIFCVNDMAVSEFAEVIVAEDSRMRYEFWCVEETENG